MYSPSAKAPATGNRSGVVARTAVRERLGPAAAIRSASAGRRAATVAKFFVVAADEGTGAVTPRSWVAPYSRPSPVGTA